MFRKSDYFILLAVVISFFISVYLWFAVHDPDPLQGQDNIVNYIFGEKCPDMAQGQGRPRRVPKFRTLAHTADLGLRIWGGSLAELFQNAAAALTATITDRRRLKTKESRTITVDAPDLEALLVAWLNHLLYLYDLDGFLGREFHVLELAQDRLSARARGDIFDPARHIGKTAVKAATHHRLEIIQAKGRWQATVVLDL